MADKLKLPVGIEDFREIRRKDFYYIDKTRLIEQLLDSWGKVNLFTRPRRFGKTLNMSMLRYFFEIGTDKTLFEGLHISQRSDLCEEYMGKFPVVSLTLKGVDGLTFERAKNKLLKYIALEAERFNFLKNSDKLTDNEKQRYGALIRMQDGKYVMDEDTLESALQTLSELLYRHYGQKVIILIDEYDVRRIKTLLSNIKGRETGLFCMLGISISDEYGKKNILSVFVFGLQNALPRSRRFLMV